VSARPCPGCGAAPGWLHLEGCEEQVGEQLPWPLVSVRRRPGIGVGTLARAVGWSLVFMASVVVFYLAIDWAAMAIAERIA
jgi:hypothetical protein